LAVLFIDWNRLKEPLANRISGWIGRELVIAGDLDVDWSLTPRIRAEGVRLENAPRGRHPFLARAAALELSVDLVVLFQGRIVIPTLRLDAPVVHLEQSRRGETNWQSGGGNGGARAEA
ncbi:MAG: AsmA family protein, partial [Planctomycetaceae bacterium]